MPVFIPNPLLEAELEKGLDMSDPANAVAEIAKSIAPRLTGAYADSIHVETDGEGARVVAGGGEVDYAVELEVGTSDTPAFHTLTRAAESAGLHIGGH